MAEDIEHPVVVLLGAMLEVVGFSLIYFLRFALTFGLVTIPTMLVMLLVHAVIDLDRFASPPILQAVLMFGIPIAITTYILERSGDEDTMRHLLSRNFRRVRDAFKTASQAHSRVAREAEETLEQADYETLSRASRSGSKSTRALHAIHFGVAVLSGPLTLAYGLWWVFGSDDIGERLGMGIFFGIPLLAAWFMWIQFAGESSTESALESASREVGARVLRERAEAQAGTLTVADAEAGGELSIASPRDALTQVEQVEPAEHVERVEHAHHGD